MWKSGLRPGRTPKIAVHRLTFQKRMTRKKKRSAKYLKRRAGGDVKVVRGFFDVASVNKKRGEGIRRERGGSTQLGAQGS